jgi:hypothetical protein
MLQVSHRIIPALANDFVRAKRWALNLIVGRGFYQNNEDLLGIP